MKKTAILLCMLALALAACKPEPEPTPNNGGQNNDTTETVVKKYLVKELLNDDPEKIRLAIDWNDDCTQILHAKYGTGNGYTVDYDFKYYGNDSIRIIISLLPDSYPLWNYGMTVLPSTSTTISLTALVAMTKEIYDTKSIIPMMTITE